MNGEYGRYEYLNWAAKFLADALMLEADIQARASAAKSASVAERGLSAAA